MARGIASMAVEAGERERGMIAFPAQLTCDMLKRKGDECAACAPLSIVDALLLLSVFTVTPPPLHSVLPIPPLL